MCPKGHRVQKGRWIDIKVIREILNFFVYVSSKGFSVTPCRQDCPTSCQILKGWEAITGARAVVLCSWLGEKQMSRDQNEKYQGWPFFTFMLSSCSSAWLRLLDWRRVDIFLSEIEAAPGVGRKWMWTTVYQYRAGVTCFCCVLGHITGIPHLNST